MGRLEFQVFVLGKDLMAHQFGCVFHTVDVFADPVQRLQIAQTAFALFDVGFDHITLPALLAVALCTFLQFGFDEIGNCGRKKLCAQTFGQFSGQACVANQKPFFDKAGADGIIFACKA